MALTAVLAVLPTTVRQLEVQCNCTGLVLRMLRRFTMLEGLLLGGNAAFVDWRGSQPFGTKLHGQLRIDCRRPAESGSYLDDEMDGLPDSLPQALSAAAGLHNLEMDTEFDEEAAAVLHRTASPAHRDVSGWRTADC